MICLEEMVSSEGKTMKVQGTKQEFIKIFKELCYSRTSWQVWADLISCMAICLANSIDKSEPRYSEREKEYEACIKRLGGVDKPAQCFAVIVQALERNPDQDFLGSLYMELELGNHWKGQFFTPYNICECMAEITVKDTVKEEVEKKGWISVNDCACGAGATLIAAANTIRRKDVNIQNHVLFVGQDIDRVVGMMCYIQLSLLGCAGYVVIANTLTNPITGSVLFPHEGNGQEFWYTPMFASKVWNYRRLFKRMDNLMQPFEKKSQKVVEKIEKEKFTFFFEFSEEETNEMVCTL